METIHLVGHEEVSRAGHNMTAAASEITRAANQMSTTAERLIERLNALVLELEMAVQSKEDGGPHDQP